MTAPATRGPDGHEPDARGARVDAAIEKVPTPGFAEALRYWWRLGWISFGGPAGQIALMHDELVTRRRWISEGRFMHALNYCMVLPGPEAQQLATYIGWLMHGTRGGVAAGALFVLPSLFILALLSWLYLRFGQTPQLAAVLAGIKPVVVAIVLAAAVRIGRKALRHPAWWGVAAAAFVAVWGLGWPFPIVVVGAALVGAVVGRVVPAALGGAGHGTAAKAATADGPSPAIGDDDPPPAHAAFRWSRVARVVGVFVALWAVALVALRFAALDRVPGGTSAFDLAWFHTKAALLTFGGAYAVLPYVYQMAVDHYQWLTGPQMIDGLALGETTPGPLIMVVAFVGYLAGWNRLLPAGDWMPLAGFAGACIATFFTFLPSFMFILAGGPVVEGTRHELGLRGPLSGITAAVVGVIVSLGLFFAGHVLTPGGRFDPVAVAIAVVALVALTRYKRGVVETIAAGAAVGLALMWLRGGAG